MSDCHKIMNIYFHKVWYAIDSVITVLSYGPLPIRLSALKCFMCGTLHKNVLYDLSAQQRLRKILVPELIVIQCQSKTHQSVLMQKLISAFAGHLKHFCVWSGSHVDVMHKSSPYNILLSFNFLKGWELQIHFLMETFMIGYLGERIVFHLHGGLWLILISKLKFLSFSAALFTKKFLSLIFLVISSEKVVQGDRLWFLQEVPVSYLLHVFLRLDNKIQFLRFWQKILSL